MTCLIVLENCENIRTEKVTVGSIVNDYGPGNSLMGLVEGEELTVRDLLYGLMLPSATTPRPCWPSTLAAASKVLPK